MLRKINRLARHAAVVAVLRQGVRYRVAMLTVRWRRTERPYSRFAFTVPNTVSNRATRRNRIRRQLRELVRALLPRIAPGVDVMVTVHPGRDRYGTAALAEALTACLRRARLLRL